MIFLETIAHTIIETVDLAIWMFFDPMANCVGLIGILSFIFFDLIKGGS